MFPTEIFDNYTNVSRENRNHKVFKDYETYAAYLHSSNDKNLSPEEKRIKRDFYHCIGEIGNEGY